MDHTCHSRVFSTVTRLLTLTESITEVPNRQVAKSANRFQLSSCLLAFFFRGHSTTMTKGITMIPTRKRATGSGLLHPHHSVLKQIKPFSRDSQALEASTDFISCSLRINGETTSAYIAIARGSPCVVPSVDSISPSPMINNLTGA